MSFRGRFKLQHENILVWENSSTEVFVELFMSHYMYTTLKCCKCLVEGVLVEVYVKHVDTVLQEKLSVYEDNNVYTVCIYMKRHM